MSTTALTQFYNYLENTTDVPKSELKAKFEELLATEKEQMKLSFIAGIFNARNIRSKEDTVEKYFNPFYDKEYPSE